MVFINFAKKRVGRHFGLFFDKHIRSTCRRPIKWLISAGLFRRRSTDVSPRFRVLRFTYSSTWSYIHMFVTLHIAETLKLPKPNMYINIYRHIQICLHKLTQCQKNSINVYINKQSVEKMSTLTNVEKCVHK
jgi:hypothetical protein